MKNVKKIFLKNDLIYGGRYAMEKGQLNLKDIARCLKKLRVDNGLTQQALADKLYCDVRQVRRYETDGTERITVINEYAKIFKISSLGILSASASTDAF